MLNISTFFADNDYKAFNEETLNYYHDTKHVQSGMVQGWNKFCLTGGIVEYSAKLPGKGEIGGLWPACKCFELFPVESRASELMPFIKMCSSSHEFTILTCYD